MTLSSVFLIADVAATGFIFLVSLLLRNTSVYDPYWSVAPIAILPLSMLYFGAVTVGNLLLLAVVCYWGVRLTANWAYTFKGYAYQDWRYDMFQEKTGRIFPLISFSGIMLFPTLVVYVCLLPAMDYIQHSTVNQTTILGFLLCAGATTVQLISDLQLHRFRKGNPDHGRIIRNGLWKYSRHPNYLGEILMWWGIFLIAVSAAPDRLYLGLGALVNTLMFVFISIPMAEKHLGPYKPDSEKYKRETSMLIPLGRFKN